MRRLSLAGGVLAASLFVAAGGIAQPSEATVQPGMSAHPSAQQLADKCALEQIGAQLSRAFNSPTTTRGRAKLLDRGYIQHNPMWRRIDDLNNVHGADGFVLGMNRIVGGEFASPTQATDGARPPPVDPRERLVVADGSFAVTVSPHVAADPAHPGQFYRGYFFDAFRIVNGKLGEHWDDALIPPNPPAYFRTPLPEAEVRRDVELHGGPPPPPPPDLPAKPMPSVEVLRQRYAAELANKRLVLAFMDSASGEDARRRLLGADLLQHGPMWRRIDELNGVRGAAGYALGKNLMFGAEFPPAGPTDHLILLVASGDKVAAVTSYQREDPANPGKTYEAFFFDAWRVSEGKLVEHWDDILIPDPPPSYILKPLAATVKRGVEIKVQP